MTSCVIRLKDMDTSIPIIAKEIAQMHRCIGYEIKKIDAVNIARNLKDSKEYDLAFYLERFSDIDMFDIAVTKEENSYDQVCKRWEYFNNLLEKGANGDVEAAIAYCKAELNGEISHAAFA